MLYDAVIVPDGADQGRLALAGQTAEFLRDQYRHCKPIFAWGSGAQLLAQASLPPALPDGSADPGLIIAPAADSAGAFDAFVAALSGHRPYARETDPPLL